ncbi:uncharacterized protein LOC134814648 [Bolinopsis microptera]|uniref:uncharacterized protein LOC134814648 n=1 Tax=Bolinopsis microptera TaxID=2820187 RepID=UPI00307A4584
MSREQTSHPTTSETIISVSKLKDTRCGTVRGHVIGTISKTILSDSSGKIEVVLFGEVLLRPGAVYEVRVGEMVLGDCVPVRSPDQIRLISDRPEPSNGRLSNGRPEPGNGRLSNGRPEPSNGGEDYVSVFTKHPTERHFLQSVVFYVMEKSNRIKKSRFFVSTLFVHQQTAHTEMISEVYIHNLKAEWYLYLIPGKFYLMTFENCFNFDWESENIILDLDDNAFPDYSIRHIPENSDTFPMCRSHKIIDHERYGKDIKKLITFAEMRALKNKVHFVNVEVEVLGTSSFEKSGFISFVDSDKNMENIAFTPCLRVLPRFLIPGSKVILYRLFMKSVTNATGTRHFLSVTHMTQVSLVSLPCSTLSTSQISTLNTARTLQNTGILNIIVSIDCILSLSVNTFNNIHCRVSVRDVSDTATLHIRDNTVFVRELFGITREEEGLLGNVRNLDHGKVDGSEGGRILPIFSRLLQSGRRFNIKGNVRLDSVQYLVRRNMAKFQNVHEFTSFRTR